MSNLFYLRFVHRPTAERRVSKGRIGHLECGSNSLVSHLSLVNAVYIPYPRPTDVDIQDGDVARVVSCQRSFQFKHPHPIITARKR
jgi:hypothetical protein